MKSIGKSSIRTSMSVGASRREYDEESKRNGVLGRSRVMIGAFLGAALSLGCLPVLSGCGGDSSGTKGVVEVDQAKLKAEQDAMRAAQEKAHQRPTGKPSR